MDNEKKERIELFKMIIEHEEDKIKSCQQSIRSANNNIELLKDDSLTMKEALERGFEEAIEEMKKDLDPLEAVMAELDARRIKREIEEEISEPSIDNSTN